MRLSMKQIWRLVLATAMVTFGLPAISWGQAPGVAVFDDEALLERITINGQKLLDAKQLVRLPTLVKELSRPRCELTLAPVRTTKLDATDVFEISRQGTLSVGLLARDDESGEWFFNAATGFVLTADGAIATSYHVLLQDDLPPTEIDQAAIDQATIDQATIDQATSVEEAASKADPRDRNVGHQESYLIAADFEGNVYPVRKVLAADKISDTCILQIDATGLTPLALNPNTRPGETIYCFSNPSDMFGHFSHGIITRFFVIREPQAPPQKGDRPVCFMSVSADFAVGSSGGPILDVRGNVVGQVQSTSSIFADAEEEHPQHPQMVIKAALVAKEILALIEQPDSETLVQANILPVETPANETPEVEVPPGKSPVDVGKTVAESAEVAPADPAEIAPADLSKTHPPIVFMTGEIHAVGEPVTKPVPTFTRTMLHFQRIQADYEEQSAELLARIDEAQTEEQFNELSQLAAEIVLLTEARCFRLANASPGDPAIIPVLEYLVLHSETHHARAFELLYQHHVTSPEIGKTCIYFWGNQRHSENNPGLRQVEKLARAVIEQNCHQEAVGLATLVLAEVLARGVESDGLTSEIRSQQRREAQVLFLRVKQHFASVRVPATRKPDGSVSLTEISSEAESGLRRLHGSKRQELEDQLKSNFFFDRNVPRKNGSFTFGAR